ncbi:MAG: hypothetical protein AAFV80_17635 [Bacteroidota bacterium]
MNRIYVLFLFLFSSLAGWAQDFPIQLLDVSDQKDRVYYYGGRNGATSPVIDQFFEWMLQEGDNPGDLRFKLLYFQNVTLDQKDSELFTMQVNLSDIHLEDLPTYNGFDFTEAFMPRAMTLNLEIYSGKKRLRSKRLEVAIKNNQIVTPMKWNFKTEAREITVQASNPDFMFTNESQTAVYRKLEQIDSYVLTFIELDEIGVALNRFDPEKVTLKNVDRELRKLQQYEKRFETINERRFWKSLDYQAAEKRTGYNIEEVRQQVGGYLAYLGEYYRGVKSNTSTLIADNALGYYSKGRYDKAQEEVDAALAEDAKNAQALLVKSLLQYKSGQAVPSGTTLLESINSPSLDRETYDRALEQGIVLRDYYIGETEKNLSQSNQTQALDNFKKAKAWCTIFPEMDCPDELFERLRAQFSQ